MTEGLNTFYFIPVTIAHATTLMNQFIIDRQPEIKPGDLKKNYEPGINRGNIAYETFCKHIERWLQNGTIKVGLKK